MPRRKRFRPILTGGQIKGTKRIEGLGPLVAKLGTLANTVESDAVYTVLMQGARIAREAVRSRVAVGKRHNEARQGPHIRDVIFASEGDPSKDPRGPNVLVGVASRKLRPHNRAVLLERGTSRTRAQPFWRPGITGSRRDVYEKIKFGLAYIISKVG